MGSISISKYEHDYNEMRTILRGISHEMGNALTVMGYSIKSFGKDEKIRENENWKFLKEDYDYICRLFRELSEYNNGNNLQVVEVNVLELLNSVVSALKEEYKASGVILKLAESENISIMGDETKLRQVFINIIKNAFEAEQVELENNNISQGIIEVGTTKNESYQIFVRDNGCGIKKENLDRIFEPMYTENKKGGTGLGLPVCKNIVEAHEGNIKVLSKGGRGTEFIIELKNAWQA